MRTGRQRFQVLLLVLVAAMLVFWVVTEAQGGPEVEPDAGSGLPVVELAMVTPIALSVGSVVMQAIVDNLTGRAVSAGGTGLAALARRVFKRGNQPAELTLTHAQAQQVRFTAFERARALGLPDAQAHLLADSFVGAIATAG